MRQIPLTQGKVALVDDEDYEYLSQFKWHAKKVGGSFYAYRWMPGTRGMHQDIVGALAGQLVDHENGDGLDNQRSNLRFATVSQNGMNRKIGVNNKSGAKGVYWNKQRQMWHTQIMIEGKRVHLGYFEYLEEAAQAYDAAATELFREFALLNRVPA